MSSVLSAESLATNPISSNLLDEHLFEHIYMSLFPREDNVSVRDVMLANLGLGVDVMFINYPVKEDLKYLFESVAMAVPTFIDGLGKRAKPFIDKEPVAQEAIAFLADGVDILNSDSAEKLMAKLLKRKDFLRRLRNRLDGFEHQYYKKDSYNPDLFTPYRYAEVLRRLSLICALEMIVRNINNSHNSSISTYRLGYNGSTDCIHNALIMLTRLAKPIPNNCVIGNRLYEKGLKPHLRKHYYSKFVDAFLVNFFNPQLHPSVRTYS